MKGNMEDKAVILYHKVCNTKVKVYYIKCLTTVQAFVDVERLHKLILLLILDAKDRIKC